MARIKQKCTVLGMKNVVLNGVVCIATYVANWQPMSGVLKLSTLIFHFSLISAETKVREKQKSSIIS